MILLINFKDVLKDKNFRNDLIVGAVYGLTAFPFIGLWSIASALVSGVCWGLGGQYGHSKRFIGCPIAVYLPILIIHRDLVAFFSGFLAAGVLTLGYSIPDVNDPDEDGLGNFYYKLFKGNHKMANIFTRGTIYFLLMAAYIPVWFSLLK